MWRASASMTWNRTQNSPRIITCRFGCCPTRTTRRRSLRGSMIGFHCARRTTLLIDPRGRIAKTCRDVDPKANSSQVLHDLASLKKVAS